MKVLYNYSPGYSCNNNKYTIQSPKCHSIYIFILIYTIFFNSCRVSGNDFPLVSGNNRDNKPDISGISPITIRGSPKLQWSYILKSEHKTNLL